MMNSSNELFLLNSVNLNTYLYFCSKINNDMNNLEGLSKKIKSYMMPIAMVIGFIFYQQVSVLSFIVPYLIFIMLLLTFIKISWRDIHISTMHIWMILFQVIASGVVYYLINPYNSILAQGTMICILAPTATSAPVITKMLGGNVESLTSYSLVSNLVLVAVAPLLFSEIGFHSLPFLDSAWQISRRVALLLILPLVIAFLINKLIPVASNFLQEKSDISFYLWSIALTIVSGRTLHFILSQGESNYKIEFLLAVFSLLVCVFQFWLGRKIGRKYQNTVAGGQGLGQKNTILAIWMAQVYLNPIASIAPGLYVVWQNSVNSWQVWRSRRTIR